MEVMKTMMNSENGSLYAALGTVVVIFGIDRITRSHYKADLKRDSITLALADEGKKPQTQESDESQ